jgi:peroxiredoxin family protein
MEVKNMAKRRKSWQEMLRNSKNLPKVVKVPAKMVGKWGTKKVGDTMLIPAPLEVDEIMKKVPKGKLVTINEMRTALAKKHGTTISCPMTSGIFSRIAAEAAAELASEGKKNITPYWRTLKTGGVINEKYPGGVEGQKNF